MKLSLNLLKKFVDISGIDANDLARELTLRTAEVEGVEKRGDIDKQVVVAEILEINKHPNAEKLNLALVDDGQEKREIVCGAKNIAVGQKVPLAKLGSVLPGNFKIKKAKIRGITSEGMLCSTAELGLADDAKGIFILPNDVKLGVPIAELGIRDTVLEIDNKSLTHRADLFSHLGFAREVASIKNLKFRSPSYPEIAQDAKEEISAQITDKRCRRYTALKISHLKVAPSPLEIQMQLQSCGIRPINNIVDITNLVLLELGQPMHAFDAEKISNIQVRSAKKGERMHTLDKEERKLKEGDILICDGDRPVALAGIMGGDDSQVTEGTTEITLESANFDPLQIRKTSSRLSLRTESSVRFEKDLDPNLAIDGTRRAVELFLELHPEAKVTSTLFDKINFKEEKRKFSFDFKEIKRNLGIEISPAKTKEILERLGFWAEVGKKVSVEVPSFRAGKDVYHDADIIEEIGRIYGYEEIPFSSPERKMTPPRENKLREKTWEIVDILSDLSFFETKTYVFTNKKTLENFKEDESNYLAVENPLSSEFSHLRKSLIPNMAMTSLENKERERLAFFETGRVFLPSSEGTVLPIEREMLSGILVEKKGKEKKEIFFSLKEVLEQLFYKIKAKEATFLPPNSSLSNSSNSKESAEKLSFIAENFAHPGKISRISYLNTGKLRSNTNNPPSPNSQLPDNPLGILAEMHPEIKKNLFGDDVLVAFFEIDLSALVQGSFQESNYQSLPKFPGITRDISLTFPKEVNYLEVEQVIQKTSKKISKVELFDIYEVSSEERSLSFHLNFLDREKTMTDEEGEAIFQKILKAASGLGGRIRE